MSTVNNGYILFNNGPRTTSAINDYVWNVEDSDLCIFIIDNQDIVF